MIAFLYGVALMLGGIRALVFLYRSDRELADKYRPTTGCAVWDAFYETQEIPVPGEVLP